MAVTEETCHQTRPKTAGQGNRVDWAAVICNRDKRGEDRAQQERQEVPLLTRLFLWTIIPQLSGTRNPEKCLLLEHNTQQRKNGWFRKSPSRLHAKQQETGFNFNSLGGASAQLLTQLTILKFPLPAPSAEALPFLELGLFILQFYWPRKLSVTHMGRIPCKE